MVKVGLRKILSSSPLFMAGLFAAALLLGTAGHVRGQDFNATGTVESPTWNSCDLLREYHPTWRVKGDIKASDVYIGIKWGDGITTERRADLCPDIIRGTMMVGGVTWTTFTFNLTYTNNNATFSHIYPKSKNCMYQANAYMILYKGQGTGKERTFDEPLTYKVSVWTTDGDPEGMGEMIFVDATYGKNEFIVCAGQPISIRFKNLSKFACNTVIPGADGKPAEGWEYVKNQTVRHSRFTYGVENWPSPYPPNANVAPMIPDIKVNNATHPWPWQGPVKQFRSDGTDFADNEDHFNEETYLITAPGTNTQPGQRFTLRLELWNACNPYSAGGTPDVVEASILIVASPEDPDEKTLTFCHSAHGIFNYGTTVTHNGSGNPGPFTPGKYVWYRYDPNTASHKGAKILEKNYTNGSSGNTINPANDFTGTDRMDPSVAGEYRYVVEYEYKSPRPQGWNDAQNGPWNPDPCKTNPVVYTWVIRENIKPAPKLKTGLSTAGCSGTTLKLYCDESDGTSPLKDKTYGKAWKYVWEYVSDNNGSTTSTSHASCLVVPDADGRSATVTLVPDPKAPAVGNVKVRVRREWITKTGPTSPSVCPSDWLDITLTVNPLPIATLGSRQDLCADATGSVVLNLSNVRGAGSNNSFEAELNTGQKINFTGSTNSISVTPPAEGEAVWYYLYQVRDKVTGCISKAATGAPFTTPKLTTVNNDSVLIIRRPTLKASSISIASPTGLLCANTNFTATANPATAASQPVTGKNISKAGYPAATPKNRSLPTIYRWTWTGATAQESKTTASFNSGGSAIPNGITRTLTLQWKYVSKGTAGTQCPSDVKPVTLTVVPAPTASITSQGPLTVCQGSPKSVDIETKGYRLGNWTVDWKLTPPGGGAPITGSAPVSNPAGANAGTGAGTINLTAAQLQNAGNYTLTLTSVKQNTAASCSGTASGSITITVLKSPNVVLSGSDFRCEGEPYTIPNTAFNPKDGQTGVPYSVTYKSSYTGAAEHTGTITTAGELVIPAAHISPAVGGANTPTTITLTGASQGNCSGKGSGQFVITAMPIPDKATISMNPADTRTCSQSIQLSANTVTAACYEGTWTVTEAAGTGWSISDIHAPDATFTIGTDKLGIYKLTWTVSYKTGGGCPGGTAGCDNSSDDVTLTFGKDAQPATIHSVPAEPVCGYTYSLESRNTLNTWEIGKWEWTGTGPAGGTAIVVADPADSRKAVATVDVEGKYTFVWRITSPPCNPSEKTVDVTFVYMPVLNSISPSTPEYCPGEQIKIKFEEKNSTPVVFEWRTIDAIEGVSSPSNTNPLEFDAPDNNTMYDDTYRMAVNASYTKFGKTCVSQDVSFSVIVKPTPLLKPLTDMNVCPGNGISVSLDQSRPLTGNPVTYLWDNLDASPVDGLGDFDQTVDASPYSHTVPVKPLSGYSPVTNSIKVIAEVRNCKSKPVEFDVTVNPTPDIVLPTQNTTYCPIFLVEEEDIPTFSSHVAGTTLQWESTLADVGLPFETVQSGNSVGSFTTAENISNVDKKSTIEITAVGPVISAITGLACTNTNSFNIVVQPRPTMASLPEEEKCGAASSGFSDIQFDVTNKSGSAISYTWENTGNTDIVGEKSSLPLNAGVTQVLSGSSGTGIFNISVPDNLSGADRTATIVVTPKMGACSGPTKTATLTAWPRPVINTVTAQPAVCPEASFNAVTFTTNMSSSTKTISWTNSNTSIGLANVGSTSIPAFKAGKNITGGLVSATITVVAESDNSCIGPDYPYTLSVKPSPVIDDNFPDDSKCYNQTFKEVTFTSNTDGYSSDTQYSWTINDNSIGSSLPASQANVTEFPSFTAANNLTGISKVGRVTVTATLDGCPSSNSSIFYRTLKPTPVITFPVEDIDACPGEEIPVMGIKSNVAGYETTGIVWKLDNASIEAAASLEYARKLDAGVGVERPGNIPAFTAAANTADRQNMPDITGTFTVRADVDGCTGDPKTFKVLVHPTPDIKGVTPVFLCDGDIQPDIELGSEFYPGASFTWERSTDNIGTLYPSGTLPISGGTIIPSFRAVNSSAGKLSEVTSSFTVYSTTTSGCKSPDAHFTITVGAVPQLIFRDTTVCAGTPFKPAKFGIRTNAAYVPADTIFKWKVTDVLSPPGWKQEQGFPALNDEQTGSIPAIRPDTSRTIPNNVLWGGIASKATIEATVSLKGCSSDLNRMYVTINPLPVTVIDAKNSSCVEDKLNVWYSINSAFASEGSYYFWGVEELPVPVPGAPVPTHDPLKPSTKLDSLSYQLYQYPDHALPWKGYITAKERNKFGCVAPPAKLLIEVTPAPVVQAGPDRVVCERAVFQLNATVDGYDATNLPAGYTIEWYPRNDIVGVAGILNPKVDPHRSDFITLRASKAGCDSKPDTVKIVVNPKPDMPRIPDVVYCSAEENWKMNVENIGKHADDVTWNNITWKRWDDAASQSVPIGNSNNAHSLIMNQEASAGVPYHTGALPSPLVYDASMQTVITYNVRQTNELGCVSDSATGRMIIRKSPVAPVVTDQAYCRKDGGYELYVAGNTISWYSSATSTIPVNTGNYYNPMPAADGTYPYWVTQKEINGCESERTEKKLIVHPLPELVFEVRDALGKITTGGCADFEVLAKNMSSLPDDEVTYTWRWGDNENNDQSAPAGTAIGHTYTNTGSVKENRTLTLTGVSKVHYNTSDNIYCRNTKSTVLAISPGVTAGFNVSATEGCAPLLARLNSGQSVNAYNFRWYWNLDHEPENNEAGYGDLRPNPDHQFVNTSQTDKAQYHVWLQVDNGTCFDNVDQVITVYPMPKASFTTPDLPLNNSFCPPEDVRFVNTSEGNLSSTEYEWNYADGSFDNYTSTQDAMHEFDNLGATPVTRNVVLTASNEWGAYTCSASDSKYITVYPRVTAEFTYDKSGCAPVVMQFTSQTVGTANRYTWDWGDGTPMGTGLIPSHLYDNPSPDQPVKRKVTLIAENNWCSNSVWHEIQINPKPHVGFTVDNVQGCQPLAVTFYNTSTGNPAGTEYSYDFGDASFDNTGNTQVTHTYVNLQAQNAYLSPVLTARNEWGCTNTFSLPITVFPYVKADFRMSATEGCAPLAVNFTNGSRGYDPGSLYWEFGDGGTSGDMNPSHIFNNQSMSQEVKYSVTLKVWTGSCSDSQTQEVTVFGNPRADFVANPPVQIYPGAPVKLENLIPAADINNLTYVWSQADHGSNAGVPFSTLPNPADLSITGWGDFDITQQVFTMDGNCSSVKMVTISIIPPRPEARFDSVPPACMPYEVQFSNNSEYGKTYQWVFGDGSTSTLKEPKHTYQDAGTYRVTLTVTGDNATPVTATSYITVHPMPHAAFEVKPDFLWVGQTLRGFNYTSHETTSGQAYDIWYRWNWGDGSPEDTAVNASHVYRKAGRYDITLTAGTNTSPQCINSYTLSGAVDLENAGDIILPNTFKPSQSGERDDVVKPAGYQNDLFYPPVLSPTRKYRLSIFNRWGQLLYETTDPNRGWNGYYRGRLCDEGVYVYKIEGVFETGQSFSKMGDILLLR